MSCELDKCYLNLEELNQINKNNSHRRILGKGSFGVVLKPSILTNSTKHVTKLFVSNYSKESRDEEYLTYDVIQKFDSNNLFTLKKQIVIFSGFRNELDRIQPNFLENIDGVNYLEALPFINSEYGGLELKQMREINFDIFWNQLIILLKGIKKLNDNGIIHRDIKEVNILYTKEKLNLIDFGLKIHKDNLFKKDELNILKYKYRYYPPEFQFIAYLYETYNTPIELNNLVITIDNFLKSKEKESELIQNLVNFPVISELFARCYRNIQYDIINKNTGYININILNFLKLFVYKYFKINHKFKTTEDIILYLFNDDSIKNRIDIYSLGVTLYMIYINASYDNVSQYKENYKFLEEIINKMTNENVYERSDYKDIIKMINNFKISTQPTEMEIDGGSSRNSVIKKNNESDASKTSTIKKSSSIISKKYKTPKSPPKKSSSIISKKYKTPKSPPITIEERRQNLKTIIENMENNKKLLNKFKNLFP
jgi:serine/threonine protein kinase